jgi:N-methylhydantoinase B
MVYRFLEPGTIAIHDDRWFNHPWGVNGGKPGGRARKLLIRADGTPEVLGNKCEDVLVAAGDLLHFITWGGGGWGDPLQRDPELVVREVRQGLVSRQGARSYGVVVEGPDEDATVSVAETEALRHEIAATRSNPGLFDRGGTIDQIRATCEAETGLKPPRPPVWAAHGQR